MLATEAGIVAKKLTKPRQIQPNTETKKNLRLLFGQEICSSAIFSFPATPLEWSEAKLPTVLER
jgi:hypothetical protein